MEVFFLFIIGAIIGSFLGLVMDRLPQNESIVFGRSHCQSCGHLLGWKDLCPILSQLSTFSRCRYCGVKLDLWYGFFETATGLLFVVTWLSWLSPAQAAFILMSLVLSILDLKYHEFPTIIWLCFSLLVLLLRGAGPASLIWLAVLIAQMLFHLKIGVGDILWLLTASFVLDFYTLMLLIELASVGGIIQILHHQWKSQSRSLKNYEIAFIPHLSLAYLALLVLPQILSR